MRDLFLNATSAADLRHKASKGLMLASLRDFCYGILDGLDDVIPSENFSADEFKQQQYEEGWLLGSEMRDKTE